MDRSCHPWLGEQQEPWEAGNAAGSLPVQLPVEAVAAGQEDVWQQPGFPVLPGRHLVQVPGPPQLPQHCDLGSGSAGQCEVQLRHHKSSTSSSGCQDMVWFGTTADPAN